LRTNKPGKLARDNTANFKRLAVVIQREQAVSRVLLLRRFKCVEALGEGSILRLLGGSYKGKGRVRTRSGPGRCAKGRVRTRSGPGRCAKEVTPFSLSIRRGTSPHRHERSFAPCHLPTLGLSASLLSSFQPKRNSTKKSSTVFRSHGPCAFPPASLRAPFRARPR
jgi:hypothetical protein